MKGIDKILVSPNIRRVKVDDHILRRIPRGIRNDMMLNYGWILVSS